MWEEPKGILTGDDKEEVRSAYLQSQSKTGGTPSKEPMEISD